MAELSPAPFHSLVARVLLELEREESVFGLPRRKFVTGDPRRDTSVAVHGRRVSSPLGPSAGPHTQMAQNIVLCWLAGARVFELKTVQALDRLTIPRPCIDTGKATYNVEWSQELRLDQSLEEYVKAAMLIEMLAAGAAEPVASFRDHLFDMSVGYDLAGIRSEPVVAFLRGLLDAGTTIEGLRRQIPDRWKHLRDLPFATQISGTVTLSTFHGCPIGEIEKIAVFLMEEIGLDCAIKLNPTLLGASAVRGILHDRLGFTDVRVPAEAFEKDASWTEMTTIVGRLRERASSLGRHFAVKLTNTLIVENPSAFLPAGERLAYLSGAPLHVLAIHLVERFRQTFGTSLPISFSAGIDRGNYPDAVSLGLAPVTVCTDLLRQGGYGRLHSYQEELLRRMDASGAATLDEFVLRAHGSGGGTRDEAIARNTAAYLEALDRDPRYRNETGASRSRTTGHPLSFFDCATCDLCIPACPNGANFQLPSLDDPIAVARLVRSDGEWRRVDLGTTQLTRRHQIATFADFCNDCGNCEMFCPDEGAPNRHKIRLFGTEEGWRRSAPLDGFVVEHDRTLARLDGEEYAVTGNGRAAAYSGPGFRLELDGEGRPLAPPAPAAGPGEIDLYPFALMNYVRRATLDPTRVNQLNCTLLEGDPKQ